MNRTAIINTVAMRSLVIEDANAIVFLDDLADKADKMADKMAAQEMSPHADRVLRTVLSMYIKEKGLLMASDPVGSSTEYYYKATLTLDVLCKILDAAGIKLDLKIIPKSAV